VGCAQVRAISCTSWPAVSVRAAAELPKNMQVEIDPSSSQPLADIDQQLIRGIDADEPRP
jgi:hypothetical protein